MALVQWIYASRPFGFDTATLAAILLASRRNNDRDGITGALICREDLYMQLLEGPADAVAGTYARIAQDDRHLEVTTLVRKPAAMRMFGAWAMRDDPARSWLWSYDQIAGGALERATEADVLGVFARVRAEAA